MELGSFDVSTANDTVGAEVGKVEVGIGDLPVVEGTDVPIAVDIGGFDLRAGIDLPATIEVGAYDAHPVDQRPTPIDGAAAGCKDMVLSYEQLVLGANMSTVNSLAFSPDGQTLSAGIDHNFVSWRLSDGAGSSGSLSTCPAATYDVAYLPDGRLVGLSCGGQFTVGGNPLSPQLIGFFGPYAVSPVGLIVADSYQPIRLWDVSSGQVTKTLASGGASSLAFTPDGAVLAGGIASLGVRLWDVASGNEMKSLLMPSAGASVLVAVSPDGRWVGALSSGALQIWSLRSYASAVTIAVDPSAKSFAFTRDGNSVITGASRVDVFSVSDGTLLYEMGDLTYEVAVSPDGTRLAASGGPGLPVHLYCLY